MLTATTVAAQTECPTQTLPYAEDFGSYSYTGRVYEAGAPTPDCWQLMSNGLWSKDTTPATASVYYGGVGTATAVNSYGCVTVNNPYFGMCVAQHYAGETDHCYQNVANYGTVKYAILPPFEQPVDRLMLSFDYHAASNSGAYLFVGYIVADTADFTILDTLRPRRSEVMHLDRLILGTLSSVIPSNARLALKVQSYDTASYTTCASNYYIGIDNVLVEELPSCLWPLNPTVLQVTNHTANITWQDLGTPAPTKWQVAYGAPGFDPDSEGETVTANSKPFTVTGLTADVDYEFRVRTVCGDTAYSIWSNPVRAMTDCPAAGNAFFGTETTNEVFTILASNRANSMSQSIYTAAELSEARLLPGDTIDNIVLSWKAYNAMQEDRLFSIYIAHTTTDTFATYASEGQWAATDGLRLVYSDTLHAATDMGAVRYDFSQPFVWNGTDNIVITTLMNRPSVEGYSNVPGFIAESTLQEERRTAIYYVDVPYYSSNLNTLTLADTATQQPTSSWFRANLLIERDCLDTADVEPEQVIVCNNVDICSGDSVTFFDTVVSTVGAYVHGEDTDTLTVLFLTVWPTYNDTVVASDTNSFQWADSTFTESTTYSMFASTIHGCDSITTLVLTIIHADTTNIEPIDTTSIDTTTVEPLPIDTTATDTTGIALALEQSFRLYPNPASTVVTVEANTATRLTIVDLMGREVYRSQATRRRHTVDIRHLVPGTYLVCLSTDGATTTHRLVIR